MASYDEVMHEVDTRASELVRKGQTLTQAEAVRQVLNGDRELYERYRRASQEPRPPVVQKREPPADDSPGAAVIALAKRLAPADPWGEGVRQVQRQDPALWQRYCQDYA